MEYFKRNHKNFCQNGELHSLNLIQILLSSKRRYQPLYRVTFLTISERRMDSYDGPSSDSTHDVSITSVEIFCGTSTLTSYH
jgi:hypothetical protein